MKPSCLIGNHPPHPHHRCFICNRDGQPISLTGETAALNGKPLDRPFGNDTGGTATTMG
jgi:hypothetical protein